MDATASVGVALGALDDTWKLIVSASARKFWRLLGARYGFNDMNSEGSGRAYFRRFENDIRKDFIFHGLALYKESGSAEKTPTPMYIYIFTYV